MKTTPTSNRKDRDDYGTAGPQWIADQIARANHISSLKIGN